ncbi:fatty acid desaturase [Afifella sp. IM 167]|uniref:fatty acid desaturase n=1 Tax=Afifella sp. IM 167 TaxID=2033586 RepID=UPI001CC9F2A5|nr:fatty acid desaturase [Afifella sp. IM 167]MBZ8133993.1 fatty acid desaturase [Afifella sp. IM 167]
MNKIRATLQTAEWPTLFLILLCHLVWAAALLFHQSLGFALTALLAVPMVTLHSSLQHEALHGHPTRSAGLNEGLIFLPLGLAYPYRRFKRMHLRHHNDQSLTDPYDDPESYYYALADWQRLPAPLQRVLDFNNTLFGRLLIGPAVMSVGFYGAELRLARSGKERGMGLAWAAHALGAAIVLVFVLVVAGMPLWQYLLIAYGGLSLLSLRTFAEHQASEAPGGRTAIVEERSLLSLLFLNNNLHYVHHEHPRLPWYRLPALYRSARAEFQAGNAGYVFAGYGDILRRYLFRRKSPVPHPYLRRP